MGQRANLILVERGGYQLFYNHWCANTLTRDLFWGPEHASAFIRIQRAVDESGWLDEVWAEGGAVVDLDRKHFLLYGGEDVLYDVPLRRVYLELLGRVWKGWTVRWAYEGIADLAEYVGYPRHRVLRDGNQDSTDGNIIPPGQKDWTDFVASARFEDGTLWLYPLASKVPDHLANGPNLVECLRAADGLPRLNLDEWTTEFPAGGFHLDISARQLDFWIDCDAPDIRNRVARAWPGWETQWHYDHYELQLDWTEGRLRLPFRERKTLLEQCRESLLKKQLHRMVDTINMLAERDRKEGKQVQVNPWALRDDRLDLSEAERIAILDKAISTL